MKLCDLPKEFQEKVSKIASKYTLPMEQVITYYLMGGEYADTLCRLKVAGLPDSAIRMVNQIYWDSKNKTLDLGGGILFIVKDYNELEKKKESYKQLLNSIYGRRF